MLFVRCRFIVLFVRRREWCAGVSALTLVVERVERCSVLVLLMARVLFVNVFCMQASLNVYCTICTSLVHADILCTRICVSTCVCLFLSLWYVS